ncbi:MAG: metal ABC transporter permease [Clostridiales bacterium]|nr:metal ABC transporter permease [Clostridiales bacterium]
MESLMNYFSYPFVRYAFAVGILVAFCASLLGVVLVLKRFSFLGDGLSHFAFGIIALAAVFNLSNNLLLVLPCTVVCAVILLVSGQRAKIKGDAAIAVVSMSALALGYLILNIFKTSSNVSGDVCSTLFGSHAILTLKMSDVVICASLCTIAVAVFVVFYNRIFTVTFDENFAGATGVNVKASNLIIAVITAVIIVLAMNLAGSLLVSALIVFPALSAMRVCKSFKGVSVVSALISVVGTAFGLVLSMLFSTPVGATVAAMYIVIFVIFMILGALVKS